MKPRILVISRTNMDFIQRTDVFPETDKPAVGNSYDYLPGGAAATYAVTVTALGGEAILCSRVGADSNGQRLRNIYRDMEIDTRFMFMERRAATGLSSVEVLPSGEKRILTFTGANDLLSSSDVEEAFTSLPDAVILKLETPERTSVAVTEFAAKKGIPCFVVSQGAKSDFPFEKLYPIEVFSPNDRELHEITGIAPTSTENCLRAAIRLASIVRAKYYVIKMGDRGAFLYDGKYYNVVLANNVRAVDTSLSGDIFISALATEYVKNKNIMRAVKYANTVAGISVSRPGSLDSIPTESEVNEFIAERAIEL